MENQMPSVHPLPTSGPASTGHASGEHSTRAASTPGSRPPPPPRPQRGASAGPGRGRAGPGIGSSSRRRRRPAGAWAGERGAAPAGPRRGPRQTASVLKMSLLISHSPARDPTPACAAKFLSHYLVGTRDMTLEISNTRRYSLLSSVSSDREYCISTIILTMFRSFLTGLVLVIITITSSGYIDRNYFL